jgi:arsenate reductase
VLRAVPAIRPGCDSSQDSRRVLLMTDRPYNVLFLCAGNSARSIIAESLLDSIGQGRFKAYSAGSHPGGSVNPLVLEYLHSMGISTEGARSKSWEEFAVSNAPRMDLVVTVCDQTAGETCPIWPGVPAKAHWSAPDPAAYMDDPDKAKQVIREVFQLMQRRIALLVSLPMEKLDRMSLQAEARSIGGKTSSATAAE